MSTRKLLEEFIDTNLENQAFCNSHNFVEGYNHCSLCGSALEFNHRLDPDNFQITEQSYCPHCRIRTKAQIYALH